MEWQRYEYRVSTDPALLQPEVIHAVLRQSYWAHDIPAELLRRAVENSLSVLVSIAVSSRLVWPASSPITPLLPMSAMCLC